MEHEILILAGPESLVEEPAVEDISPLPGKIQAIQERLERGKQAYAGLLQTAEQSRDTAHSLELLNQADRDLTELQALKGEWRRLMAELHAEVTGVLCTARQLLEAARTHRIERSSPAALELAEESYREAQAAKEREDLPLALRKATLARLQMEVALVELKGFRLGQHRQELAVF